MKQPTQVLEAAILLLVQVLMTHTLGLMQELTVTAGLQTYILENQDRHQILGRHQTQIKALPIIDLQAVIVV